MSERIACVYVPSFPLQVRVREQPHLSGRAVAIVDRSERPSVAVCSRAAHTAGVRPGMTPLQARALVPELEVLPGDPDRDRRAARALAEALMPCSATVDVGPDPGDVLRPHRAIYLRVPRAAHRRRHLRGARFGDELLAQAHRLGYRARAGVADDRFTAWAAAAHVGDRQRAGDDDPAPFVQTCTAVPRGGSPAFLAPLSIEFLPLDADVRSMLSALGIRTLGEFAALPPPSVGRRWNGTGVDLQALARGEGTSVLTPFTPEEPIREEAHLDHEIGELEPLSFVLRPLCERVCERLRGRGLAAAGVALVLRGPDRTTTTIDLAPSRPTLSSRALMSLARAHLSERSLEHPVTDLALEVADEAEPEIEELDLFDHRDAEVSPEAIDAAIARLRAAFGAGAAGAAELVDTHRPEAAYRMTSFSPPGRRAPRRARRRSRDRDTRAAPPLPVALSETVGALRLVDPPSPQPDLGSVELGGERRPVVAARGPTRIAGEWWSEAPMERDYYEVETADGGRYWVFQGRDGRCYLHGIFD